MDSTLYVGAIVHFVMPDDTHQPAIVVKIWGGGTVGLQVFDNTDEGGVSWHDSVTHVETPTAYTWHFIEA